MTGELIASNILLAALGVMLYLIVRALPRVDEETYPAKNIFERWLASELPEKLDTAMNAFLLKFLRKAKVVVMKIDNYLNKELKRVRPEDGIAAAQKPDLRDLVQPTEQGGEAGNGN